jgi:hypothetical protein
MRIGSNPSPQNPVVRPIPIHGASPPQHVSQFGAVMQDSIKENQDQEKRHQFGSDIDETVSIHFDSKSLAASFRASITSQKVLACAVKMSVSFVFNLLLVLVASTVLLPAAF